MPAKTTIAAAEKRVIKNEIRTLVRARKKIRMDTKKAFNSAYRDIASAKRKYQQLVARINRAEQREASSIARRISILEGRL